MTDFTIETGTIPATVSTRTAQPNPFTGRFPTPEGESMVVVLPSGTPELDRKVNTVVNQAQSAAREAGFTCRVKREATELGTGKNAKPATRVILWSVKKISHAPMTPEQKAERAAKRRATLAAKKASESAS